MSNPDLMLTVIALCLSFAALAMSVISLIVNGRRERERWVKDKRADAYIEFVRKVAAISQAMGDLDGEIEDYGVPQLITAYAELNAEYIRLVFSPRTQQAVEAVDDALREVINTRCKGIARVEQGGIWIGFRNKGQRVALSAAADHHNSGLLLHDSMDHLRAAVQAEMGITGITVLPTPGSVRIRQAWAAVRRTGPVAD